MFASTRVSIVVEEAEDAEGTSVYAAKTEGHIRPVLLLAAHPRRPGTLISANNTLARDIASQEGTHTLRRHFHRAKRIILIRHGESEGNVDESAYVNTATGRSA